MQHRSCRRIDLLVTSISRLTASALNYGILAAVAEEVVHAGWLELPNILVHSHYLGLPLAYTRSRQDFFVENGLPSIHIRLKSACARQGGIRSDSPPRTEYTDVPHVSIFTIEMVAQNSELKNVCLDSMTVPRLQREPTRSFELRQASRLTLRDRRNPNHQRCLVPIRLDFQVESAPIHVDCPARRI